VNGELFTSVLQQFLFIPTQSVRRRLRYLVVSDTIGTAETGGSEYSPIYFSDGTFSNGKEYLKIELRNGSEFHDKSLF
jgi:hypothetical protein